jgi:hypothetical protein
MLTPAFCGLPQDCITEKIRALCGNRKLIDQSRCFRLQSAFTKRIPWICDSRPGLGATVKLALCFHQTEVSFIASIDFSFQNFSNRSKKNNQLDTLFDTQYFFTQ